MTDHSELIEQATDDPGFRGLYRMIQFVSSAETNRILAEVLPAAGSKSDLLKLFDRVVHLERQVSDQQKQLNELRAQVVTKNQPIHIVNNMPEVKPEIHTQAEIIMPEKKDKALAFTYGRDGSITGAKPVDDPQQ